MTDESIVLPILLSAARASPGQRRAASLVVLTVLAASIATLPFATTAGPALAGFVLVQQAWMGLTDLITAALLLGQFWVQPARRLNVLAGGYLFTALTTVPYALSFPGALSDNGLFITGPLSTPWIFLTWYAALPLVVIAYGFSRGREKKYNRSDNLIGILLAVFTAVAAVVALTTLVIAGYDWLPAVRAGNGYTPEVRFAIHTAMALALLAFLILAGRRPYSVLDTWLMVVMFTWLNAMVIGGGVIGTQRYDIGNDISRAFYMLASTLVLLVLLLETIALHARAIRYREQRLAEMKRKETELLDAETALLHKIEDLKDAQSRLEAMAGDLIAARDAAESANRAKSEFLAGMSHEIRTPITCSLGLTDLLVQSQLTAQQRRWIELQRDANQSLLTIVDDLLDIAKIEAGKLELNRSAISVAAVAEGAAAVVKRGTVATDVELRCDLAADLPGWIEGDETRLRQVLLNLLSNAIKFTERGRVVLRVRRAVGAEPAQLRFEVEDTGIGIDPAQQHLLFQRFSQVGDATQRRYGGTGLGLAISRNLVEAMGGAIGVDSRLGKGSLFWFTIPYVETKPQAAAERTAADSAPCARVLVAEDNAMIREVIEVMLADAGHEVVLVRNGIEAIEALQTSDFDVVLMDVQMPELDGMSATRLIRAMGDRSRNTPIIALTAYAMAEDIELCRAAGANDHLSKPIDRGTLLHLVAKWSGSGRARSVTEPDVAAMPQVMDDAVLDALEERLRASRVAVFSAQFRDHLQKAIDIITATTDRRRIADEMHNLISSAGVMGCTELVTRSRALMEAAQRDDRGLEPLIAQLTIAAGRALAAVQARTMGTRQPSATRTA